MNNAKMWLVVNPTVGIPLFLTAVAVGSFAVHLAVLSKVSWYDDFLSGQGLNNGATVTSMVADQVVIDPALVTYLPEIPAAVLPFATDL